MQSITPDTPEWFERVVMRLLSKSPDHRIDSAIEVAGLLEDCLAHVQQPYHAPLPRVLQTETSGTSSSRSRWCQFSGFSNSLRWLAAAGLGGFLLWLSTILVLETSKGTLRIETSGDVDVPIRITQNGHTVQSMTVTSHGSSTRLKAGEYELEFDTSTLDAPLDGVEIRNGNIVLKRGGEWTAKITLTSVQEETSQQTVDLASIHEWTRLKSEDVWPSVNWPVDHTFLAEGHFQDSGESCRFCHVGLVDLHVPLHRAIDLFNRELSKQFAYGDFSEQPPLTEDEVVACCAWEIENNKPESENLISGMRVIAEQRSLPLGWRFAGGPTERVIHGETIRVWETVLKTDLAETLTVRERALSPPIRYQSPHQDPPTDSRSLQSAIDEFNATHHEIHRIPQPPLSLDEVLAGILLWKSKREETPSLDDATFENLQQIALTHHLPTKAKLQVIPIFESSDGNVFTIWSVRIVLPQASKPDWTFAFEIRKQFVSKNVDMATEVHWGKPGANGIQAGFRLIPAQSTYRLGQIVDIEFLFRGIYGTTTVNLPNAFTYQEVTLRESDRYCDTIDRQERLLGGWIETEIDAEPISRRAQRLEFSLNRDSRFTPGVGTRLIVEPDAPMQLSFAVANPGEEGTAESLRTGEATISVNVDKLSPFADVRFDEDRILVAFQDDRLLEWRQIENFAVMQVIQHAQERFGDQWQKRIAEDLVEVLAGMGHVPGDTVRLVLVDAETGETLATDCAPMTQENRSKIYRTRRHR